MAFKLIAIKLFIHLPPRFASNPMDGVDQYLSRLLLRFVPEVDGIVLAYSDVRPETSCGRIINDSPHLHFYIRVRFTVFRPERGNLLDGVVNKVSPDHMGLLIHGTFNASIPADQIPQESGEFSWNEESKCWKRKLDGNFTEDVDVGPGAVVRFSVSDLMKANDMLTISGSLLTDPSNTGLLLDGDGLLSGIKLMPSQGSSQSTELLNTVLDKNLELKIENGDSEVTEMQSNEIDFKISRKEKKKRKEKEENGQADNVSKNDSKKKKKKSEISE
ncbi:hypothetical protein HK096_002645 [Nowakowskiella sp. JEL0078]|nr:hypothetical protein HK096_002645 [Nowakowskiella sp. JEL0078]